MSAMASQTTSFAIVYSTVYSRRKSKKTSKLRVTGLCAGNSPVTGEFPAQRASNAENVSIWWRHHAKKGVIKYTRRLDYLNKSMLKSVLVNKDFQTWLMFGNQKPGLKKAC